MPGVFISCVEEDLNVAQFILRLFERNGLEAWIYRRDLLPGQDWQLAIHQRIREGSAFVPLFSDSFANRQRTYMNEELNQAIEELRRRPANQAWFVPVSTDGAPPPELPIGGGRMLSDIHYANLQLGWNEQLERVLRALGVDNPIIEIGEPLGAGLGSFAEIAQGTITYLQNSLGIPTITNLISTVDRGWAARSSDGAILISVHTIMPRVEYQSLNEAFGLSSFYALCDDGHISTDPNQPNRFFGFASHFMPAGTELFDTSINAYKVLELDMDIETRFEAAGALIDRRVRGSFVADIRMRSAGAEIPVELQGEFDITLAPPQ